MTLELASCTYAYRRRRGPILQDLTYHLPSGLTVLLGPNGAGKSTLLKLAASVIRPSAGHVTLDGTPAGTKKFRETVAWMPQDIVSLPSMTAREYVAYAGWLKGMSRKDAWSQARRALNRVQLTDKVNEKSGRLSGGQLRRVGVAAALVHNARILLLDEPTAGMDPHQRRVFRDLLASLVTEGVQILLSTHDVADLAEEAHHVTVLNAGSILQQGTTEDFLAHTPPGTAQGRAAEAAYTALLTHHGASAI
ncbi:ATP-binding cassette domain-containing protein [Streptomyces sp. NPDC058534]|uniref:ATP-binding cassette domain-containing protein n=1 Tax=Streptomyces sp. NPDC058534 TaxID=3346541 RepID=UPI003655A305